MGRVGSCYDNSPAESWFATCKAEIGTRVWDTRGQARLAMFAYLTYYNHRRLHSTLQYRTLYEAPGHVSSRHRPRGMKPGVRSRVELHTPKIDRLDRQVWLQWLHRRCPHGRRR